MDHMAHWESVYRTKDTTQVSWYQPTPARSLALLAEFGADPDSRVLDVGGGDSRLVDGLLAARLGHPIVLDISSAALDAARARLGPAEAARVTWLHADILDAPLPASGIDIWHDRAAFHFLRDADEQRRYAVQAARAIRPGGILIVAGFAADGGPTRCSGLDVARHSPESLTAVFDEGFMLERTFVEVHHTPGGADQRFLWAIFRRRS